jgi:hypothetical protein
MTFTARSAALSRLVAVVGVVATVGCSGPPPAPAATPEPEPVGRLKVVNRSASDMDIYLVRGSERVRLGLAANGVTTSFALRPAQVAGLGAIHFEALPLGGQGGQPVRSEPVTIRPDDVITLDIPPP